LHATYTFDTGDIDHGGAHSRPQPGGVRHRAGCMSMTGGYSDQPHHTEMLDLIRTAVDLGVTFFDTAEIYGPYVNEELSSAKRSCRSRTGW
jgi:Aldo/keto reductase family